MAIQSIRFLAKWQSIGYGWNTQGGRNLIEECGYTEFTLGIGPCGKNVVKIETDMVDSFQPMFQVRQHCDDGEIKTFVYQMRDVLGRIEMIENSS